MKVGRGGFGIVLGVVVVASTLAGCTGGGGSAAGPSSAPASSTAAVPSVPDGPATQLPSFPTAPASPPVTAPSGVGQVQQFLGSVFTDSQSQWSAVFAKAGVRYTPARMVLFSSAVNTGCGTESAEVGPFYCPADLTVYLDVSFFDQMNQRYGVSGDFALAYVVAHELGHHIQNLTGVSSQVARLRQLHPAAANALSILTELQADCYAGVWAYSTYRRGLLEPGDIQEAMTAAAAVGDDFLQASATGTIRPEQWTHGTSAQRQQWLTTGYQTGSPAACDTFAKAGH